MTPHEKKEDRAVEKAIEKNRKIHGDLRKSPNDTESATDA